MPQGSILAPLLYCVFINDLGNDIQAEVHLYADDTIVYTPATSVTQAIEKIQIAFQVLQRTLKCLRLVLNAQKTKIVILSKANIVNTDKSDIFTFNGTSIE